MLWKGENGKRVAHLVFRPFRVASSRLQIDATLKNKGAVFAYSWKYITTYTFCNTVLSFAEDTFSGKTKFAGTAS